MEDIFPKGLDLNSGQEPFGFEEETPMEILDLEGSGIPNSGGEVNLCQRNDPVNSSLPEVERGKSLGGVEGSHDSKAVKPSDLLSEPLVEPSRVVDHKPKSMLCTDLNEVMAEPPENPMPFVIDKPPEAGLTVLNVGSGRADDLTHTTDGLLEGDQPGGPLQTTTDNQFSVAHAEGTSEATCFVDQRASCGAVIEVEEIGLGSTEPMSASLAAASYSVDFQDSAEGLGSAIEIGNSAESCRPVSAEVERRGFGIPVDRADQQQSLEMKLTDLGVENHRCCALGDSGVMSTHGSHLESTSDLRDGVNSIGSPSDLQGRVNSMAVPSNPQGNVNLMEDPSGLLEKGNSMEGTSDFQGRANSIEDPSGLMENTKSMKGPFDLQGRVDSMEGPSCPQKSMERHTEGLVSAQDATNFEGQESSMAPPDAEQVCAPKCLPKEHRLSVGDLVWGKVKYHPWWPGQVFDPLGSSELARKKRKKDRLLVACFGDQTFAWCEETQLRPFRQNFAEMSKQSTAKALCNAVNNALDELARRVKYGLACSCLPQKIQSTLDGKPTVNSGIHEGVVVNDNRDVSMAVTEFEPKKLLAYIQNLAISPFTGDALEITMACAQVSAFCALERVLVHGKTSAEIPLKHEAASGAFGSIESGIKHMKSSVRSSSGKRRQSSDGKQSSKNKKRRIGDLFAGGEITDNGGNDMTKCDEALLEISGSKAKFFKRMTGIPQKLKMEEGEGLSARKHSLSRSKKQKVPESYFSLGGYKNDSKDKQGRMYMNYGSPKVGDGDAMKTPKAFRLGECISKIASQLTGSPPIIRCTDHLVWKNSPQHGGKKAMLKRKKKNLTSPSNKFKSTWVVREDCPIKQLLLEFSLLAQNPTYCPEEETVLSRVTSVFLEFRDAVFQKGHGYWSYRKSASLKPGKRACKQKSPIGYSDLTASLSMDGLKDMDWTDKKVASSPNHRQVQRTLKRKSEVKIEDATTKKKRRMKSASLTSSNEALKCKLEDETVDHGVNRSSRRSMVPVLPVDNEMESLDESNANQSPTALFMRFPPGFDVPSETELEEKFAPFGPLETSETKVFSSSGCAQIVFKRCSDAEAAFHGATANKVFGSVTVSFRLRYLSSRMKTNSQIADHGNDEGSRLHTERLSLLENTSRNVKQLKENAAQPSASEVPSAEGFGTSRINPSEVAPLVFQQQNLETVMTAPSPSVEQTPPSTTSKVDNVAPGSKSNIVDAMMGLLQKVSTLVGSPN